MLYKLHASTVFPLIVSSFTVQLNINFIHMCTILECFPLILFLLLMFNFTLDQNDMQMHQSNEANLVNVILVTNINKILKMTLDANLT